MMKNKCIIVTLLGLFFALNIFAQEKQESNTQNNAPMKTVAIPSSTDNPPADQIMETKKTETVDKSGNVQKVTTIEFF